MTKRLQRGTHGNTYTPEPAAIRWKRYGAHREKVTTILNEFAAVSNGRLSVWGAGSCMDIDLSALLSAFNRISLVDIREDAFDDIPLIQKGIQRERIAFYNGIDLFGLDEMIRQWKVEAPEDVGVTNASILAGCHALRELPVDYGVVLSGCVLSQIIEQLALAMGESHPRLLSMISVVRERHLELMLEHTAPEGYAILMTDLVSSLTAPILAEVPDDGLEGLMDELIAGNNFFTGCNPYAIVAACKSSPRLNKQIKSIRLMKPWRWQLQKKQFQLVYCLIIQRMPQRVLNAGKAPFLTNSNR